MLPSRGKKLWTLASAATLLRRPSPNIPLRPIWSSTISTTPDVVVPRVTPLPARVPIRLCTNRPTTAATASSSFSSSSPHCWNCDHSEATAERPFLSCPSCKAVQPVDAAVDYFQIFDVDRDYEITDGNLEIKYKDWQKKLHPDLVHTKSERERSYAADQSARVIEAYRTLSKPISRAVYLMRLEGIHVDEEQTLSDTELLTEVMEIREAVDEAKEPETLEQIRIQLLGKLESWSNSFSNAFKRRQFEEAVDSIQRMTYYEKAIQEIVKKL